MNTIRRNEEMYKAKLAEQEAALAEKDAVIVDLLAQLEGSKK